MTEANRAFIGLGSNRDDPAARVLWAIERLRALPRSTGLRASGLYLTPPWGMVDQPDFVNAVAALDTTLEPLELLDELQALETAAGRRREGERWGPRVLDLDLLLYGDRQMETPRLTVPHPRMHERAFVLVPLLELAPGVLIPGHGPAARCLDRLDRAGIRPLEARA